MRFGKLAAVAATTGALIIPVTASAASASVSPNSCVSGTAGKGTIYQWGMEVCSGTNGGVVITYEMKYNMQGRFKVWNHDDTSQWYWSEWKGPWHNGDQTNKMTPYYSYTCAQFEEQEDNGAYVPLGPIGCLRV
jgi:hypothetical protein